MPRDQISSAAPGSGASRGETPRPTRRSVLRGAAGAGAAGVAATTLAGLGGQALAASARPAKPATPATTALGSAGAHAPDTETSEQIVVHLRDARTGEIDVFRGTSQTRLRDPELAARLVRASLSPSKPVR